VADEIRAVVFGPPLVGKSAVAARLLEQHPDAGTFSVRRYSLQRDAAAADGRGFRPDEVVIDGVRQELERGAFRHGFVFDALPINRRQAELLDELLEENGTELSVAVHMAAAGARVREAVLERLVCEHCEGGTHPVDQQPLRPGRCPRCGAPLTRRVGDDPAYLDHMLQSYEEWIPSLVDFYRGRCLLEVDAFQPTDVIVEEINTRLAAR
jgi:adenylate kinase